MNAVRKNDEGVAGRPGEERRVSARSTLVCKAVLYSEGSGGLGGVGDGFDTGGPSKVFVSNISMTGVGLRVVRPVMPGSEHRLTLEAGPLSLRARVRVMHCKRKDDRTWEAGFEFIRGGIVTGAAREAGTPARVKESVARNPTRMLTPKT